MNIQLAFEPRNVWIGLTWRWNRVTTLDTDTEWLNLYVCLLPCLPVIIKIPFNMK